MHIKPKMYHIFLIYHVLISVYVLNEYEISYFIGLNIFLNIGTLVHYHYAKYNKMYKIQTFIDQLVITVN